MRRDEASDGLKQRARQIGDSVERSDGEAQVVGARRQVDQIFVAEAPVGGGGEQRSGIDDGDIGERRFRVTCATPDRDSR